MGCCSSSETRPIQTEKPKDLPLKSYLDDEDSDYTQESESFSLPLDDHARNLYDYITLLLKQDDSSWKPLYSGDWFSIKYQEGSPFDASTPVVITKATFSPQISAQAVYSALLDQNTRMNWDGSIKKLDLSHTAEGVIQLYVQLKMPFPFSDRDIMERHIYSLSESMYEEVYYSIEGERVEKHERGWTFVGYSKILQSESQTEYIQISQTSLKSNFNQNKTIKMGAGVMKSWLLKLQKHLNTALENQSSLQLQFNLISV